MKPIALKFSLGILLNMKQALAKKQNINEANDFFYQKNFKTVCFETNDNK
ncbi:hypothetical protein [Pedobacter changchengzhani]|nr:hypothetical protein [Pedobacter changchengzhani]